MATHLGDLREFVDKAELTFELDGRHYSVPPVTSKVWLQLQALQAATETGTGAAEADMSRIDLTRLVLGPVFDQLADDGVDGADMQHIVRAVYYWQLGEQDIAVTLWAAGGKAEAPQQGPEPTSTTPTGSTGTASANGTRRRASTTATTSRRKSATSSPKSKAGQTV